MLSGECHAAVWFYDAPGSPLTVAVAGPSQSLISAGMAPASVETLVLPDTQPLLPAV